MNDAPKRMTEVQTQISNIGDGLNAMEAILETLENALQLVLSPDLGVISKKEDSLKNEVGPSMNTTLSNDLQSKHIRLNGFVSRISGIISHLEL